MIGTSFSPSVKEIISYSHEEALRLGNPSIQAEHLLLAILRSKNSSAFRLLEKMHVNIAELRNEIEISMQVTQAEEPAAASQRSFMPLDKQAELVLNGAKVEAESLKEKRINTDHLMLSILNSETIASQIISHIRHN